MRAHSARTPREQGGGATRRGEQVNVVVLMFFGKLTGFVATTDWLDGSQLAVSLPLP